MIKHFYLILCMVLGLGTGVVMQGQTITCNNHINVSVNYACTIDLTIDMFIEGDINLSEDIQDPAYTFVIYDLASNPIIYGDYTGPTQIDGIVLDANLLFEVYYNNINLCWGTVLFEDKIAPAMECDCPVGGLGVDTDSNGVNEYAEECMLSCYELPLLKQRYWDRLRDDLIPEDVGDFLDDNTDDNCDGLDENNVSYYDVYEDLGCRGTLLRRTWTITYPSGLYGETATKSCYSEYYFKPVGLETLDTARLDPVTGTPVPAEDSLVLPFHVVKLTCGSDITPKAIAAFFDDPATRDQDTDDNRRDPDELDIDLVVENNEGIPYAYPHYYIRGRNPSGPHPQAINNEVCNIIVGYSDTDIESCAANCYGNRKVLRTWTILDWCSGEYVTYGQIIKVIDTEGPNIDVRDISVSVDPWKCSADVLLPSPEHLSDFCDNYLTYRIGSVSGGVLVSGNADLGYVMHNAQHGETYRVEYISEDCCGNIGRTYIDVVIVDLTPPVPVTKEFIVTSLTNIGNPIDGAQGIAKIYAQDIDNGSYDGCSGITVAVRRTGKVCPGADTLWGDFVRFCCEDLEGFVSREIDVQFRVTDDYGNVNYAWSTILLEDKSGSTQTCPDDLILTCDMDYNDFTLTGLPRIFSSCGELSLNCDPDELISDTEPRRKGPNDGFFDDPRYDGVEVPAYDPSCGYGAVRRQFRSCSSCVQWFVIEPINPFNPSSITFPQDVIIDCDAADTGEPDFDPSTCSLIGVSVERDTFFNQDGACHKILNHWTIINWCAYDPTNPLTPGRWDYTQQVKLIDTQDPILTVADSICVSVGEDCLGEGVQLSARATDEGDCSSEWLKWEVVIDLNSNWTADYTFGSGVTKYINGSLNPFYIFPSAKDELVTINLPDGIPASNMWHRAVWRVYDGCGNNVSRVRYFQITDKKAPTPYCLNLSTAVMSNNGEVELWAVDFNTGSFDNCTPEEDILFTFTNVPPPPRDDTEYDSSSDLQWYNGTFWYFDPETGAYRDRDDYFDREADRWEPGLRSAGRIFTMEDADHNGQAKLNIYAWDASGNVDHCIVNLRLIDNMGVGEGRVAGQVMTETGAMVEDVMTELMSDAPGYPAQEMTDNEGKYAFDNIPFFNDYTITTHKNDDYLKGVSTLDLLLIQRHVLGQQELDSPYKKIAADINNDGQITAIDLIELRKLILGIYTELPANESWRFVDARQILNIANPWSFVERLELNDLKQDMDNGDFVAVKIGDVNNSVDFAPLVPEEQGVRLEIAGMDKTSNSIQVSIHSASEALFGCQFALNIQGYVLRDITSSEGMETHANVIDEHLIVSMTGTKPGLPGETIMVIELEAKAPEAARSSISVDPGFIKPEAYVGEDLSIVNLNSGIADDIQVQLLQNIPNPFSDHTVIGYYVPKEMTIRLSLTDVAGKLLKEMEHSAQKGYNEIVISRENLPVNGMVYYTLETENTSTTKHMIVIE